MQSDLQTNQPQPTSQLSRPDEEIKPSEELKYVVEERRFVVKHYMQALALYVTLSGFGLKELSELKSVRIVWLVGFLFTVLNILAIYAAGRFKSMWQYADRRERELTTQLHMNEPHSLIWGYKSGVGVVISGQLTLCILVFLRVRFG